jgi:hypothetical protein
MGTKVCILPVPVLAQLLLQGKKFEVTEGIPVGATLVRGGMDQQTGSLVLVLTHDSFPMIQEGTVPQSLTVTVKEITTVNEIQDAEFKDLEQQV